MNSGGLGARERGKSQGNGRGGRGVFVGTSMEGDKGLYAGLLRGIAGDAALRDLWRGRRRRRQRLRRVWLTGGSRLSVAGKKKERGRALGGWVFAGCCGCWLARGLLGWPN